MKKLLILIIVAIAITAGCSQAGNQVVVPPMEGPIRASETSHSLLGLWQISFLPDEGKLDIVPLRSGDLHLNAIHFLEVPPYVNLSVTDVQVNGNIIDADVSLRHPFLGMPKYSGFDTRGILITNGSVSGFTDPLLRMAGEGDTRLLNPDGYTRWWNPSEFPVNTGTMSGYQDGILGDPYSEGAFDCTLNAYKSFADDIDPDANLDDVSMMSRCVFSAGQQNTRHYTIEVSETGFVFNYAVDASWQMPDGPPPYDVPDSFGPGANCVEAWNAVITETENTLWTDGGDSGGNLKLEVDVWDHYDAMDNLLYVESPGNFDPVGPIEPTIVSTHSATFFVDILDATPHGESIDLLLTAQSEASGYQGLLPGEPICAYFTHSAEVFTGSTDQPPVALSNIVTPPPFYVGEGVEFDASASYDPDGGDIVSYEWDFDGDGSYGDPYDSGTDVNPTKIYDTVGIYFVWLRVMDDEGYWDTTDSPMELEIIEMGDFIWVDDDAAEPFLGTFEQPFPTFEMGIDAADATYPEFSHIKVKAGSYTENIICSLGNVTIEGNSDPGPTITSPDDAAENLVNITGDNTSFINFQVQPRTEGKGIAAGGSGISIEEIIFIDNPDGPTCSSGVTIGGGTGNNLDGIYVNGYHKTGSGFISASGTDIVVTDCVILNLTFDGPSNLNVLWVSGGYSGDHPDMLVARNVIGHITHDETVDDTEWCRAFGGSGLQGATVRNNLVFDIDNKNTGGWTWGIDLDDGQNMTVEHNTVSGLRGPAWIYGFEVNDWNTDPSGVTHRNHIVANLTTTGSMQSWRWAYLGHWSEDLPVDYSCAWNTGNAFYSSHSVVAGTGFITTNPMFFDAGNDDYRVGPGSDASGGAHDGSDMGAYGGPDPLTWLP